MERREFEMTQGQQEKLLEAMAPQPAIMLQCGLAPTAQSRANSAWLALGREMGFDGSTAQPVEGKSERFFTAVPVIATEGR